MKSKNFKRSVIALVFLFFLSVPFLQSLFFSQSNSGVIQLNQNIQADFFKSDKKIILLFFGYVGCQNVCAPFLTRLSSLYESPEFQIVQKDVDIFFINLTPEIEPSQADIFAKYFNKNFHGIYLSKKELLNIDRNFNMFFSRSIDDKTNLNHTDYLYLIETKEKDKFLKNMYSIHPLKEKQLINDIIALVAQK